MRVKTYRKIDQLTPAERRLIVHLRRAGLTRAVVAARLGIGPRYVTHIYNLEVARMEQEEQHDVKP